MNRTNFNNDPANMTPDALRAHYLRVADGSPVQVLLYNIPKYMHFRLSDANVTKLIDTGKPHPRLVEGRHIGMRAFSAANQRRYEQQPQHNSMECGKGAQDSHTFIVAAGNQPSRK